MIFSLLPNFAAANMCPEPSWNCVHIYKSIITMYTLGWNLIDLIICIALILLCITKFSSQVFFNISMKKTLSCSNNKIYDHILILLTKWVWHTKIFFILWFSKNYIKCQLCIGHLHFTVLNSVFTNSSLFKLIDFLFLLSNLWLTTRVIVKLGSVAFFMNLHKFSLHF